VLHDSFSSELNRYKEYNFDNMKESTKHIMINIQQEDVQNITEDEDGQDNLFDIQKWIIEQLPYLEHPHYTKPRIWRGISVPNLLLGGDHKKIQKWRKKWY
jgi:hypothetical protein